MTQPLKHGSRGQAVRALQQQLNLHGAKLAVDGDFGAATEAAVRAYQVKVGLVPDGIAGAKTLAVLAGAAPRRFLSLKDLQEAARRLDVPLASVLAVNEVESNGARIRRGISLVACLLIAALLCAGLEILLYQRPVSPWQAAIAVLLCILVYRSRGNLAALLRPSV